MASELICFFEFSACAAYAAARRGDEAKGIPAEAGAAYSDGGAKLTIKKNPDLGALEQYLPKLIDVVGGCTSVCFCVTKSFCYVADVAYAANELVLLNKCLERHDTPRVSASSAGPTG